MAGILRSPTAEDVKKLLAVGESHGFPGMRLHALEIEELPGGLAWTVFGEGGGTIVLHHTTYGFAMPSLACLAPATISIFSTVPFCSPISLKDVPPSSPSQT